MNHIEERRVLESAKAVLDKAAIDKVVKLYDLEYSLMDLHSNIGPEGAHLLNKSVTDFKVESKIRINAVLDEIRANGEELYAHNQKLSKGYELLKVAMEYEPYAPQLVGKDSLIGLKNFVDVLKHHINRAVK